jgi:hypothetical protein
MTSKLPWRDHIQAGQNAIAILKEALSNFAEEFRNAVDRYEFVRVDVADATAQLVESERHNLPPNRLLLGRLNRLTGI